MSIQVAVDNNLLIEAIQLTGLQNQTQVINKALQELIERNRSDALSQAFGQLPWDGDLEMMRLDS